MATLNTLTVPQEQALTKALASLKTDALREACDALLKGGSVKFYFDPSRVALSHAELHSEFLVRSGRDKFLAPEDRAACEHWRQSAHEKEMAAVTRIAIQKLPEPAPLNITIEPPATPDLHINTTFGI